MSQTVIAAFWMIGAIVSFSAMAIAGRAASVQLDTFEIMLYRSLIGLAIVATLITVTGRWGEVTRRRLGTHLIRNMSHFVGQNMWFYAITVIPLAQVFALEFTSPLWVVILSPLLLGEALTRRRAIVAIVGFIGILIVARPTPDSLNLGVLCAAGAAFSFAFSNIYTRKLTRTETITCVIFYLTLMQAVLGLIAAGADLDIAALSLEMLPWVALISATGLVAHYCLASALSLAPASTVMPVDFVRLPLIAVIGMAFYNEPLDLWVFLGAALIFGANYVNILAETRAERE